MRRLLASVALVLFLAGSSLVATVIEPATLREITMDAALIVRGQITDVRAVPVGGRGVESIATVAVTRVIKGESGPFLSVRVPGGVVGRYRYVMLGAPTLRPNQSAVFFLARDPDNGWRPIGLSAGIVHIRIEPATGRQLVQPVLVAGRTASVGPVDRGDIRRRALPVDEFESLVALVMASEPGPVAGATTP